MSSAMPLWKASYRLSLPGDAERQDARGCKAGRCWRISAAGPGTTCRLTLLSGNPVTFRQALYESYYVPRQTVPVESGPAVLPPPDTGTRRAASRAAGKSGRRRRSMDQAARRRHGEVAGGAAPAPPPPPPPRRGSTPRRRPRTRRRSPSPCPRRSTCAAGQSLVVPLLDRDLPARRIDLYQPSVDGRHPLAAVELTNDSGTGLPPGVLTLYQQGAGERRALSRRCAAGGLAGRRQAAVELRGRRQGDGRPRDRGAAADGQGDDRRRGHEGDPGDPLHDALPGEGRRHAGAVDADRAAPPRRRHPDRSRPEDGRIDRQRLPHPVYGAGRRQRRARGGRGAADRGDDPHHRPRRQPARRAGLVGRARPEAAPGARRGREPAAGGRAAARRARPAEGAARPAGRGREAAARQSVGARQRRGDEEAPARQVQRDRDGDRNRDRRDRQGTEALAAAEKDLAAYVGGLNLIVSHHRHCEERSDEAISWDWCEVGARLLRLRSQ